MPITTVAWYLFGINVLAFLVNALDAKLDGGVKPRVITSLVTIAGGSLGTIVAMLVWDPKRRKHATRPRVFAFIWLFIHVAIVLALVGPNHEATQTRIADFYESHILLSWYLLGINIATFIAYADDKIKAMREAWRIPEAVLLAMTLAGGSLGALLAMDICNHKIRTERFMIGVPVMLCVHLVLLAVLAFGVLG